MSKHKPRSVHLENSDLFSNQSIPKLSQDEQSLCEGPITVDEALGSKQNAAR